MCIKMCKKIVVLCRLNYNVYGKSRSCTTFVYVGFACLLWKKLFWAVCTGGSGAVCAAMYGMDTYWYGDCADAITNILFMKKHGFVMMVGANESYTRRMEYFRQENPQNDPLLIYSMWSGYLDEKGDAYNPKLKALYDRWPRHLQLHTSGHAYREDIEEMIRLVHPTDAIIPIHTEEKEKFCHLAIGELQELVHPLSDGGVFYHYGNDVLNINKILQGGDLWAI